jgi:hypothetical protein
VRTETAAEAKNGWGHCYTTRDVPKPGTQLRLLYDFFKRNAGYMVRVPLVCRSMGNQTKLRQQLIDFYGFDLRYGGPNNWLLAGEWVGAHYVDYVNIAIDDIMRREAHPS